MNISNIVLVSFCAAVAKIIVLAISNKLLKEKRKSETVLWLSSLRRLLSHDAHVRIAGSILHYVLISFCIFSLTR